MTLLDCLYEFLICTGAVLAFCVLISTPKKTVLCSSVISGVAYVIYRLIFVYADREILAYFIATVFISLASEICARIYKKPSTVFIFPGIIPLVPGVGLYNSMYCLVQGDQQGFGANATNTVFIAGAIAIAVAVVHILARSVIFGKGKHSLPYRIKMFEETDDGSHN
jgi:uncharacterized membrane protein YjjB (DUF3815 family)